MTASLPFEAVLPEPGKLFAERYEIQSLIGSGGHSRVYSARKQPLDHIVAVKVLTLEGKVTAKSREVVAKRFYREARLLSRLRGPNTLRVYDYGRTDSGQLFMISEFVDGLDLKELLRSGPLPERRARKIFAQILKGLVEVHNEGFLHRDIKPSNIMVFDLPGERDHVKLLDFGIAKSVTSAAPDETLTKAGFVIGTPGYMSPEQALGRPIQPASDVYSAGLVAFEMVTGRSPYLGLSLEQMQRQLMSSPLRLPGTLELSPDFRRAIEVALAVEPTDRYESAAAALLDLGVAAETTEVQLPERPPASNVLTFPLEFDITGSTAIDTLTDPDTGMTTTIALPNFVVNEGQTPVDHEAATDLEALPAPAGKGVLIGVLFGALVLAIAVWFATRGPDDDTPVTNPDIGGAIDVAADVLSRSARNAELDAQIRAKEAVLEDVDDDSRETPPDEPEMEFEEEVAPEEAAPEPEPEAKPKPRPSIRKKKAAPKPRKEAPTEPPPAKPKVRKDFDVKVLDEL